MVPSGFARGDRGLRAIPRRIAGIYLALGASWILFSDALASYLVRDAHLLTRVQTVKGWAYVAATGGLLYGLLRRYVGSIRRSAEALVESEVRYRTLFESAGDAILILDGEGEDAGRIVSANPAAADLHGYTVESLLGLHVAELDTPESAADLPARLAHVLAGETSTRELTHRKRDGAIFHVEAHSSLVEVSGHRYVVAFYRDISARKQAEAELRRAHDELERRVEERTASLALANERLREEVVERRRVEEELRQAKQASEAASRVKSAFLADVGRELGRPLASIAGYVDLVLDQVDGPINEEQRRSLGRAAERAAELRRLVDDILELSEIEGGRVDLGSVAFDLEDLLAETLQSLAPRAEGKGLELRCAGGEGGPRTLIGDPKRLRRIVSNLVDNAIRSTERGEVAVRVEKVAEPPGRVRLQFSVEDTGVGIEPERQEGIFEAFRQGPGAGGGAEPGLGLAIAARLVETMGGRIWVESEPGRGSTFHFTAEFQR